MAIDTVNALVTLQQFYDHASIGTTDQTNYSAYFENVINGVSWSFNEYTNRKLKSRAHTEYRESENATTLLTYQYPITSTASEIAIYIDSDRVYGATTKVDSDDIIIYSDFGKIILEDNSWSNYPQGNKIVYTAGYTTIPYDIQLACLNQCKYMFNRMKGNEEGITSVNYEGSSITVKVTDLLDEVKRTLDTYRRLYF